MIGLRFICKLYARVMSMLLTELDFLVNGKNYR